MSAKPRQDEEIKQAAASWMLRREKGLSPEAEAEFKRWLERDPRHAAMLARHERVWTVLDRPRATGQADSLLKKLAERKRRRYRNRIVGTALIAIVAGAIGLQIGRTRNPGPATTVAIVLPETRLFEDGSVVELRPDARIVADFNETRRLVVLHQGEAHFQVAHQARPFVVVAGGVGFRAVGTAFSVRIEEADVELLVTEGRVSVGKSEANPLSSARVPSFPETSSDAEVVLVPAGNRIVVGLKTEAGLALPAPTVIPPAELSERMAWRIPRLEFTETPVYKAAEMLSQYNATQLVIEDPELGRLRVSGLFRADRVETFVRLLEANFNARAEYSDGTIRLNRAH